MTHILVTSCGGSLCVKIPLLSSICSFTFGCTFAGQLRMQELQSKPFDFCSRLSGVTNKAV
jgi:hypothetical protein